MKWMLVALAASSAPPEPCELHVWPAFATGAQSAGWLSNLGIAGALQDYENNKDERLRSQAALIVALPPQKQAALIAAMNLQEQLGFGKSRMIAEAKPVDAKSAKRSTLRQSRSAAACYAELIISRNTYKSSPLHGQVLSTQLSFRDFRNGKPKIVSRTESTRLTSRGGDLDEESVAAAFEKNVLRFFQRLHRPINRR